MCWFRAVVVGTSWILSGVDTSCDQACFEVQNLNNVSVMQLLTALHYFLAATVQSHPDDSHHGGGVLYSEYNSKHRPESVANSEEFVVYESNVLKYAAVQNENTVCSCAARIRSM